MSRKQSKALGREPAFRVGHRPRRVWIALLAACLFVAGSAAAAYFLWRTTRASSANAGQQVYLANCAICHGIDGTGGRGPSLQREHYDHAPDEGALWRLIQLGVPAGEMPGNWTISDTEILNLVRYLRTIRKIPREILPGDPVRGEAIYAEQNCASCHIIGGQGFAYGPELTRVGLRRSAGYLRESLLRPAATAPDNFAMVYAVTNGAAVVEGIRLNEDPFTIQLRNANGEIHSFRKAELRTLRKQFRKSPMPAYDDKLTAGQIEHLVAYMATLRGEE